MAHFSRMARVYRSWGFYRKALVQEAAETGLPVVRHPFIHYPDDATFYEMSYQQFMVGDQFMIAPLLDPDTDEVTVYLPEGRWVHLWTGDTYDKGWVTIAAPLGETAVFYRQGSAEGLQFRANLAAAGLIE
jgi:alpha-glucosidase